MPRHRNDGLRKICRCPRSAWNKCAHAWHLNFFAGGRHHRFSLDREFNRRITGRTEARELAEAIRTRVRAGDFRSKEVITTDAPPTLEQLGRIYFEKHRGPHGDPLPKYEEDRWNLILRTTIRRANGVKVPMGAMEAASFTRHDVAAFQETHRQVHTQRITDRRGRECAVRRGGIGGANRCLIRLRAFFNWAIANEYLDATPFKRGPVSVIRLDKETERERRLEPGEEERLLAACNPHLRALVTAALESCCRVSELLKLRWRDVRFDLNEIRLPAKNTKARRLRILPMSTRLRALLEMRQHDPAGNVHKPERFVFGDELGERVQTVDTAWRAACRRAGIKGLHFHDLRREAGSRLLEGGVAEHYVQRFLDHANLSTTSRYLKTTTRGLHQAMELLEARRICKKFASSDPTSAETDEESRSDQSSEVLDFQSVTSQTFKP